MFIDVFSVADLYYQDHTVKEEPLNKILWRNETNAVLQ
jgi:hypothetical protein